MPRFWFYKNYKVIYYILMIDIVLITGAPGCGKTHVSNAVHKKMSQGDSHTNFESTDYARDLLRKVDSNKERPILHVTSSETYRYVPDSVGDEDKDICGLKLQSEIVVMEGIFAKLKDCIKNNQNIVLEGIHLVPSLVRKKLLPELENCNVLSVVIATKDVEQHLQQLETQNSKSKETKINNIDTLRKMQNYYVGDAQKNGTLILENNMNADELAVQILEALKLSRKKVIARQHKKGVEVCQ